MLDMSPQLLPSLLILCYVGFCRGILYSAVKFRRRFISYISLQIFFTSLWYQGGFLLVQWASGIICRCITGRITSSDVCSAENWRLITVFSSVKLLALDFRVVIWEPPFLLSNRICFSVPPSKIPSALQVKQAVAQARKIIEAHDQSNLIFFLSPPSTRIC